MGQELLNTFTEQISELALCPSVIPGEFKIEVDGLQIWERKTDGGFPDVKQLKQRVRDIVNPYQDLGHLEKEEIGKKKRKF